LSAKANTVEDIPAQKRYEKKSDKKRNIIINSLVPLERTPLSRKRVIALSVESQVIMHLSADIGQKTTTFLRQI